MTNREKVIQFWSGDKAAKLSYPVRRGRWPDADTIDILKRLCIGHVCDIGCGTGRCSDAFEPDKYIGVDINRTAIAVAARQKPDYDFQSMSWDDQYPWANTYLFYTVLQHIPDDEIPGVLKKLSGRVVIQEIMLREYRNEKKLRFHRIPDEYRGVFDAAGFEIINFEEHPTNYQVNRDGLPPLVRRFMVAEER